KQDYDFRLAKTSVAIDRADPATATKTDRNAMPRDERPDVGAYEFKEEKTEEPNPQE
ncbi:choice-of-anchor Q domain-containing protein, partial [Leyella stercorea]